MGEVEKAQFPQQSSISLAGPGSSCVCVCSLFLGQGALTVSLRFPRALLEIAL